MSHSIPFAFTPVLLTCLPAPAFADVHVVDGSGAGEFTDIQSAVARADCGDVILLRPGFYTGPVVLDGLGVHVVSSSAHAVTVFGEFEVRNLAASDSVVLSGLDLIDGFYFHDCAGSTVVTEDLAAVGGQPGVDPATGWVSACAGDPASPEDSLHLYYHALILTSGPRVLSEPRAVVLLHPSL